MQWLLHVWREEIVPPGVVDIGTFLLKALGEVIEVEHVEISVLMKAADKEGINGTSIGYLNRLHVTRIIDIWQGDCEGVVRIRRSRLRQANRPFH